MFEYCNIQMNEEPFFVSSKERFTKARAKMNRFISTRLFSDYVLEFTSRELAKDANTTDLK